MKWIIVTMAFTGLMAAESIGEIRELYSEVHQMIDSGEDVYLSELDINTTGTMYPALGTYGRSFDFYWGLDEDDYPSGKLLFISANSQYAAVEQYEEFLFNGVGELVFYFSSGGYDMAEERFYFDGNNLLRYIKDGVTTDHPDEDVSENGQRILMESDRLYQCFNLTH